MSLSEFTPGPWWVDDRREMPANRGGGALQVQARHRGDGSSYCVASVNHWEVPEANAHLIAAAPELFEALRLFVDDERFQVSMGGNPIVVERAIAQAHAALAKARGES